MRKYVVFYDQVKQSGDGLIPLIVVKREEYEIEDGGNLKAEFVHRRVAEGYPAQWWNLELVGEGVWRAQFFPVLHEMRWGENLKYPDY